jgi:iron complex transport system permease protein
VVGASLSVAGVALQALLRNPLAEPYILGVSGGAGVGAAIVTTAATGLAAAGADGGAATGGSLYAMFSAAGFSLRALAAFAGAVAASFVVLSFGRRRGHIMPSTLLLVGVMVNAVCGSVILGLTYLADPARSHEIVIWLMGNLGTLSLPAGAIAAASLAAVAAALLLWRLGGRLNVMSLGDEEAMHPDGGVRARGFRDGAVGGACGADRFRGARGAAHNTAAGRGGPPRALSGVVRFRGGVFGVGRHGGAADKPGKPAACRRGDGGDRRAVFRVAFEGAKGAVL